MMVYEPTWTDEQLRELHLRLTQPYRPKRVYIGKGGMVAVDEISAGDLIVIVPREDALKGIGTPSAKQDREDGAPEQRAQEPDVQEVN